MSVVEKVGLKMEKIETLLTLVFMYQVRGSWYTVVCGCAQWPRRGPHMGHLCPSPLYSLETVFLADPKARLAASEPQHPSCLQPLTMLGLPVLI